MDRHKVITLLVALGVALVALVLAEALTQEEEESFIDQVKKITRLGAQYWLDKKDKIESANIGVGFLGEFARRRRRRQTLRQKREAKDEPEALDLDEDVQEIIRQLEQEHAQDEGK